MKYLGAIKNFFSICVTVSVAILLFSFIGFLIPIFREVMFFVVLAAVLILSLYKLEYGLCAVIIELVLGSKGYLFYFDFDGFNISLRIGIFLIVFSIFLGRLLVRKIKLACPVANEQSEFCFGVWKKEFFWLTALFVLIIIGYFQGLFRNYGFQNTFLDANGYFYLLYLFPFLSVFQDKEKIQKIKDVILSSGIVLAIFTLFLFYIFSRELFDTGLVYGWLRNNLLFEVTFTGSVFRIFAQSQIFLLLAFFLALNYFAQRKNFHLAIIASFLSVSALFVSLSRSFFVGLLAGLFVFFIILFLRQKKEFIKIFSATILIFVASIIFLWTIEPQEPHALIGRASSVRPSEIEAEPASFTRQEELKPLLSEIIKKPFLGWGFGKTVTFETRDPRALTMLPQCIGKTSCPYTTYAFEWGYLDLWLKLGLFGLVSLFGILYALFKKSWFKLREGDNSILWLMSSLVAISVTNIFSPYLNHPLGLGILILITVHLFIGERKQTS